jgi:cytochrome c5
MCHTPLNVLGAPEEKYALTGGFASGSYAPNISFSRFVNTSVSQIVNVFINNKLVSGQNIIGPMAEVVHDSLEYLTPEDLAAIATYLKSVESRLPPAKHAKITKKTGQKIYDKYCTGCHSIGAGGAPKLGEANDWAPRLKLGINTVYKNAINGMGAMPPRGTCATCSDAEIQAAVDYILQNSKAGATTQPTTAAKIPKPSLELGEKIYKQVCAICHDRGQLGAPIIGDKEVWEPIIKKNMDILITHTIGGYKGMPARGACYYCSDTDLIAAVIYMVNQSKTEGNYQLW